MDFEERKAALAGFLRAALAAVNPEQLTSTALASQSGPATVIAIGKAASGMCRGAARVVDHLQGICVTASDDLMPDNFELIVGDHPIPGSQSLVAGRRVLEVAEDAEGLLLALISGGGSALCEYPIDGVSTEFLRHVNERLLDGGASIDEINLVRRHLSQIKNGGLAKRARVPVETYVMSDVCGGDVALVASGPTIHRPLDPAAAIATMAAYGIDVTADARQAILRHPDTAPRQGNVTVLADGHTATAALVSEARAKGVEARSLEGWVGGQVETALERFVAEAGPGLTVAAGEPDVVVRGEGNGGRNTHTALLAAALLAGSDAVFGAFATDGADGNSESGGAIVDGRTLERGGDHRRALATADSAGYLAATGDLMVTGPTGTNVADIWALWR